MDVICCKCALKSSYELLHRSGLHCELWVLSTSTLIDKSAADFTVKHEMKIPQIKISREQENLSLPLCSYILANVSFLFTPRSTLSP